MAEEFEDPLREQREEWLAAMKAKGHTPIMWGREKPYLDIFVTNDYIHNGPGCSVCRWTTCWHCDTIEDIPQCWSSP